MKAEPTGEEVLALPISENDADAATVKEYLVKLLKLVWIYDEGFSGKRPFGNSGWKWDFAEDFVKAGWIDGKIIEQGWVEDVDNNRLERLVQKGIEAL